MVSKLVLAAAALSLSAVGASAQETHYQLERTDTGYVRLDTTTGEMTICEEKTGQLICRLAKNEETGAAEVTVTKDELARMSESIRALSDRIAALEKSRSTADLPSEEEFDRTMTYMERFFKGFMGIVKDMESENAQGGQKT